MLHTCLYTICFVFCYTSWCFYAFSRTNLLTRCHSASSLFSAIFMSQKSYTGNILGIGRNKSQSSFFPDTRRSPKQRRMGASRQAHHRVAWPTLACTTRWWGHPSAYIFSSARKPKGPDQFSSKHTASRRHRRREIERVHSSSDTSKMYLLSRTLLLLFLL
jgi:hypothetical protein